MSGGHFEYQESYLEYLAERLERDIGSFAGEDDERDEVRRATDDQVAMLAALVVEVRALKAVLRQYDLAMSADTSMAQGWQAVASYLQSRGSESPRKATVSASR